MESTAVAAAARVISFHCIICFDQFNLTDRAPVILPCGHTYLCEPCSKRIKTCMECRTPLFWTPPPPKALPLQGYRNVQNNVSNRYAIRYQQAPVAAPASPVKHPEPIPLPIPKNVVLLAMMEASERQAMMAGGSVLDVSAEDYDDEVAQDGDEDTEQQRIVAGMQSFSGPCGTYAVRDEEGLAVLPQDPRRRSHDQARDTAETLDEREPFMIEKGQTVQIVDVKDGVFKLARGMGFIVASESQLVKVGGPLDKSCQQEGMVEMAELRVTELQGQLKQIERLCHSLKADLSNLEAQDPTHPIISLAPIPETQEQSPPPGSCPSTPVPTKLDSPFPPSPTLVRTGSVDQHPNPQTPGRQPHSPIELSSPYSIDNSDIARRFTGLTTGENNLSLYQNKDAKASLAQQFGCSSLLFGQIGESCYDSDNEEGIAEGLLGLSFDSENSDMGGIQPPSLTCSPSMRSICAAPTAVTSPHLYSPPRTASFDTIDFRTGMSGHRGLTSTRRADRRGVPPARRRTMMSEHTGISRIRGPIRPDARSPGLDKVA